jgi:hypothetical protein
VAGAEQAALSRFTAEALFSKPFRDLGLLAWVGMSLSVMAWVAFGGRASFVVLPWLLAGAALAFWVLASSHASLAAFLSGSLVAAACLNFVAAQIQFFQLSGFECCVAAASASQIAGNLMQRNNFGSLMAFGFLGVLWIQRTQHAQTPSRSSERSWLLGLGCFAFGLGSAQSLSRTAFVVTLCLVALAWLWQYFSMRSMRPAILLFLLGYAFGAVFPQWLSDVPANTTLISRWSDDGALSRLDLWANVMELVIWQPWAGYGWRSLAYAHYSHDFSSLRFMEMVDNAHLLPLQLAVALGLPIALGMCALLVWLVWRNKPWRETHPDRQFAWGILLVMGIHSMLEYPLWYGPFFLAVVLSTGILFREVWKNGWFSQSGAARSAIDLGVKTFAFGLLAFTLFAAFDYHRVSQIYLQPEQRSRWYTDDPLKAAKKSVLFQSHAKFAELQIMPLSRESAPRVLELSSELVRWSPEPRIIEKLIESAAMMGMDDLAAFHLKRYKVAYPVAHAAWAKRTM